MAFQAVPDTVEAAVLYNLNGQTLQNTFHFERAIGYDQADIDLLATDILTWAASTWMANLSQDVTLMAVEVTGLSVLNDIQAVELDGVTVGGQSSQALPNNVSFAVKRYSSFTGRSARGRIYVAGLPLNALTTNENVLGATPITNIVTDLNAIITAPSDPAWQHVIVSRYSGGAQRPFGVVFLVIGYQATDNTVDSQRARLP